MFPNITAPKANNKKTNFKNKLCLRKICCFKDLVVCEYCHSTNLVVFLVI